MRNELKRYIKEEFLLDNSSSILYNDTVNDTFKA